jgi:uncharacterized protein YijF (DUF1287 family)
MRVWWVLSWCVLLIASTVGVAEGKSIHVLVALADNEHQGIVPVPESLGNGDDARNNLYWGALYGVKTFFRKSDNWELVSSEKDPEAEILERCVFRSGKGDAYLVADAYRGSEIRKAVTGFLAAAGGEGGRSIEAAGKSIPIHGGADLIVYVGHNGLMDFTVDEDAIQRGEAGRDAMVLACRSKPYFEPWLSRLDARPVLLTTGLMAPEAYTLEAAIEGWRAAEPAEQIRERAAAAYHKYQKCGMSGARGLFYSGVSRDVNPKSDAAHEKTGGTAGKPGTPDTPGDPKADRTGKVSGKASLVVEGAMDQIGKTTKYDPSYVRLDYPGGDVPIDRGVCTDVVIRALRAAGVDLQVLIHEDMKRSFESYPDNWGLSKPDRNIDHRRVPNIATFLRRKGKALPVTKDPADYQPGDIVAWKIPDGRPHMGIVSNVQVRGTGRCLAIHNIGRGAKLEDRLFTFEITGHYRYF